MFRVVLVLVALVFLQMSLQHPTSNCTADYMESLIQQALQVKEKCGNVLSGRYDCCKAKMLAKLVQLHSPQTAVFDITHPCALSGEAHVRLMTVRCDMESDGGGWTVILRRDTLENKPRMNFDRDWNDYETGFGDPNSDYWIGLKTIHCLTAGDEVDMMIDLQYHYALRMTWVYHHFKVAGPEDYYRISIGDGRGPPEAYDAMSQINGSQFTTRDVDRDSDPEHNCASNVTNPFEGKGGWWYSNCDYVGITHNRIAWFRGGSSSNNRLHYLHFPIVEMKIRSKSCNKECH